MPGQNRICGGRLHLSMKRFIEKHGKYSYNRLVDAGIK